MTGDEQTVFPSIRRETAQAVGEEQISRQTHGLVVPFDAIVCDVQRAGQRVAPLGAIELAGQRAPIA